MRETQACTLVRLAAGLLSSRIAARICGALESSLPSGLAAARIRSRLDATHDRKRSSLVTDTNLQAQGATDSAEEVRSFPSPEVSIADVIQRHPREASFVTRKVPFCE